MESIKMLYKLCVQRTSLLNKKVTHQKDFSVSSIKLYCKKHNISRWMNQQYMDQIVQELVSEVSMFNKNISRLFFRCISHLLQYYFYIPYRRKFLQGDIFARKKTLRTARGNQVKFVEFVYANWEYINILQNLFVPVETCLKILRI